MKYTIKDIAKQAGVSTATVSRTLNGIGNVDPHIKERILRIVSETGFVLNSSAKGLRLSRTHTIGIIVSDLLNSYDVEILKGIESVAFPAGYRTIVCDCDNVKNQRRDMKEKEYLKLLYEGSVDGMILVHSHLSLADFADLKQRNLKLSVLGVDLGSLNIPSITVDKIRGAYEGTRHFCTHGYTRIACINGMEQIDESQWRINGYYQALREFDIPVRTEYIVNGGFTMKGGGEAFAALMNLFEPPEAIFFGNDEMAIGALREARLRGIDVPGDIAVIGYDDIIHCDYVTPPLTSVRQPKKDLGIMLCERMIQSIEHDAELLPFPCIDVKPNLVIRESCGCKNSPHSS
jgi:DNA-binding LacI/PurR family transcriptional regulator